MAARAGSSGISCYKQHNKLHLDQLPTSIKERLAADGYTGTLRVNFSQPADQGAMFIHRTHPLVVALADTLLERELASKDTSKDDVVTRAGAAFVGHVSAKTTVLLLRLRHQLTITRGSQTRLMLCEETVAVSATGASAIASLPTHEAQNLLGMDATRNMPAVIRDRHLQQALDAIPGWQPQLETIARERAQTLLQDHRRVREAADAKGTYQVTASLPVDVMGVYVLVPSQSES